MSIMNTKITKTEDLAFFYCVNPYNCVPQAHGGASVRQTRDDGKVRFVNYNQRWEEIGPWS